MRRRRMMWIFVSRVVSLALVVSVSSFDYNNNNNKRTIHPTDRVLILDVDNTLYNEASVREITGKGIEEQIINNTHLYCQQAFNMTKEEADELYRQYGSTIEGIRQTRKENTNTDNDMEQLMKDYYETVWPDTFDYSTLVRWSSTFSTLNSNNKINSNNNQHDEATGYTHHSSTTTSALRELLSKSPHPIYLASNSPSWHVKRVLRSLGLNEIPTIAGILTPDTIRDGTSTTSSSYPTKSHDTSTFFRGLRKEYTSLPKQKQKQQHPKTQFFMLDDSKLNIAKITRLDPSFTGLLIANDNLGDALQMAFGHLDPYFVFDDVAYLRAKNQVDLPSIHGETWNAMGRTVAELLAETNANQQQHPQSDEGDVGKMLRITDLGAGLLSMLTLVLEGHEETRKPSLMSILKDHHHPHGAGAFPSAHTDAIGLEYNAYESNLGLRPGCEETLSRLGFQTMNAEQEDSQTASRIVHTYVHATLPNVTVRLHWYDYKDETAADTAASAGRPHVIFGCCFADLVSPQELMQSLLIYLSKFDNNSNNDHGNNNKVLCYFPITFSGTTQFLPAHPFEKPSNHCMRMIPSDTLAFRLYSKALSEDQGHSLNNPHDLLDAVRHYGGTALTWGPSPWMIHKEHNPVLFSTMLYFFGKLAAPHLLLHGFDSRAWMERSNTKPDTIMVSNVDILFQINMMKQRKDEAQTCNHDNDTDDATGTWSTNSNNRKKTKITKEEILFTAPYLVRTRKTSIDLEHDIGPDDVLIQSEYSLISSGTELKIYQGSFDDSQPLDTTISGMAAQRMRYPLSYGYSLVGRILQAGKNVDSTLVGRLAFGFAPHATHAILPASAIQLVPDGISAQDAIFMPSVETAVSLVHDAHVRTGDQVAVYGQGLIGLLVTAILSLSKSPLDATGGSSDNNLYGSITTFDTIPNRLLVSAAMGASQALLPIVATKKNKNPNALVGPFDVSIEVSGNARALQSAIDNTRNGGRIIVGSWYGTTDVSLQLGIDFHRSHKTIQTSQVSDIPASLRELWTKERRFGLTWQLVKVLQPSKLLLSKTTSLEHAADAYESLERGQEIAVAFTYRVKKE